MSSASPSLVLGERGTVDLFEPRLGVPDRGGDGVQMLVKSHRLAPAGAGGACVFRTVWVAIRHKGAISLDYKVFVDDIEVIAETYPLLPAMLTMRSYTILIPLSLPILVDGIERSRQRPQGTWIQVQFETDDASVFAIDGLDIEWEQVQRRET